VRRLLLKCDGTRAETRFGLSAERTSPFKSAGASVQSTTTGSRGVRISGSNAAYTTFRGSVRLLATHSIRQFPVHFPSRASPCAIRFQLDSTQQQSRVESSPVQSSPVQLDSRVTGVHTDRVESNQVRASSDRFLVLFEQCASKELYSDGKSYHACFANDYV
jgi:hypothetical protein